MRLVRCAVVLAHAVVVDGVQVVLKAGRRDLIGRDGAVREQIDSRHGNTGVQEGARRSVVDVRAGNIVRRIRDRRRERQRRVHGR